MKFFSRVIVLSLLLSTARVSSHDLPAKAAAGIACIVVSFPLSYLSGYLKKLALKQLVSDDKSVPWYCTKKFLTIMSKTTRCLARVSLVGGTGLLVWGGIEEGKNKEIIKNLKEKLKDEENKHQISQLNNVTSEIKLSSEKMKYDQLVNIVKKGLQKINEGKKLIQEGVGIINGGSNETVPYDQNLVYGKFIEDTGSFNNKIS